MSGIFWNVEGMLKKYRIHPAQAAVAGAAAVFCVWICLPGFVNAGTLLGVLLSIIIALCGIFAPQLGRFLKWAWKHAAGKLGLISLGVILAVFLGICGYNGAMMARYSCVPIPQVKCVMILGCQVHGEDPGGELENRLNAALPLIQQNPGAPVIATGGQGRGESVTEAECMRRWLISHGVEESRIFTEGSSTSTAENFANSAPILSRLGIYDGIAVVTNDFHQYRAELNARSLGLSVGHYSAPTRALVFPNYLIRELAALFFEFMHW